MTDRSQIKLSGTVNPLAIPAKAEAEVGVREALKESRVEVAEIRKNICEVHDAGAFGLDHHPKFDEHANREIARLDGLLDRIDAALANLPAKTAGGQLVTRPHRGGAVE